MMAKFRNWLGIFLVLGVVGLASLSDARTCESLFSQRISEIEKLAELDSVFAKNENPERAFPGGWLSRLTGWKRYEFHGALTVSLEILKRFPPDQFYYVGIGRSPYLFLDLLSFMSGQEPVGFGPNRVATLVPISYNEYVARKPIFDVSKHWKEPVDPISRGSSEDQRNLQQLFDRFLPSTERLAGRKLLIFDFSDYGSSLAKFSVDLTFSGRDHEILFVSARQHTESWYLDLLARTRFGARPVNWWQIAEHPAYELDLRARLPRFHGIDLRGDLGPLAYALDGGDYKSHAPFPHFIPKTGSRHEVWESLRVRSAYVKFAKHLKADLQRETESNPRLRATIQARIQAF